MSKLICPFCGQEIKIAGEHTTIMSCFNGDCKGSGLYGEKAFWQELIRTRKALDVAVDALKSAKARLELINNSKFANLNCILQIQSQCEILKIEKSLEQITAEQKDVK